VISIIISGGFLAFSDIEMFKHDQTLSRFASMLSSESVKNRVDVWEMAWNGIKERPVLGWGQENFIGIYSVNPIALREAPLWMDRAHNIVVEWLTNAGIPGLFSYLMMFGSAFYILRKTGRAKVLSRNETIMILTALLVYFIQNLFTFDTINTYMIFFALLAYIDNLEPGEKQVYSGLEKNIDLKRVRIISVSATLAALLCFSFVFYYLNYKPIRQARKLMEINFSSQKDGELPKSLREFNNALSYNTFGDSDVRESMRYLSYLIVRTRDFNQKGALKFIQTTVNELRKEIAVKNYNLEFMSDLIIFFNQISVYEKSFIVLSEELIKRTMDINPEYEWLYMVMADVNIMKKDYESAYANIKSIADMDPENERKQFKLALTATYSSREEAAKQALENIKKKRVSKDENILSQRKSFLSLGELYQLAEVYRDTKRYNIAIQYLKEIIRTVTEEEMYFDQDVRYYRPRSRAREIVQIYTEIAWIYVQLNDRLSAMQELEEAVKIYPEFSENVRNFIDSINN
jgi:tetratricopeptide (TPR) repeat protein